MKNRFYLACTRDNVGSNIGWHGKKGKGYSTDIEQAETFTLEEAQRKWEHGREYDQPISADHVDELALYKVDCQYIPHETIIDESCDLWVAFSEQCWDGNDVFWVSESDPLRTTYFSDATTFTLSQMKEMLDKNLIFVPFILANKAKRKTFDYDKLNPRTMIQAAGLRIPKYLRNLRRRKEWNGKVRMNCPTCGRINWQYDPHEFDSCTDTSCDSHYYSYGT